LASTVAHFTRYPGVVAVVVAAPQAHVTLARRKLASAGARGRSTVVVGGRTRQESVRLGLLAVPGGVEMIIVHDAVRPLITRSLLDAVVQAAAQFGAAICALPISETVKRVREGFVDATLDRAELWAVQTPQVFRADLLREAHEKARRDGVLGTDDATLVERLGHPVRVVPGLPENVKITTIEDLHRVRRVARR